MKKLLLGFSFLAFTAVHAQNCTPSWPAGSGPGIMPDSATNLPTAIHGQPYSAVVQFKVPLDTTATIGGIPFAVTIQNITVDDVTGLDAIPAIVPFTYVTNPSSGVFPGDSLGCALITGTPAVDSVGVYPITFSVTANAVLVATGTPVSQPYTIDYYRIVVDYGLNVSLMDLRASGLVAYPSATSGVTTLGYFTSEASHVNVRVINALGQQVLEQKATSAAGSNEMKLDLSEFANGLYLVSVQAGNKQMSTRVTLNK